MEKFESRASTFQSRTSRPPTLTLPSLTSQNLAMRCARVVLPPPLGPTMAQELPWGIESDTCLMTSLSPYEKDTSSSSMSKLPVPSMPAPSPIFGVAIRSLTLSMQMSI